MQLIDFFVLLDLNWRFVDLIVCGEVTKINAAIWIKHPKPNLFADNYLVCNSEHSEKNENLNDNAIWNRFHVSLNIGIEWARLSGSKLRFLSKINSTSCTLYDVNLDTKEFKSKNVLTKFTDGKCFDLKESGTIDSSYFCSKRGFYVAYKSEGSLWKIAVLVFKTREWLDTGIEIYNKIWKIFVDENEILTAVAENPLTTATTFYRYSLKKPDSLVNLAWFSYTQEFKTTGKREKLFEHLPYTCDLRLQLPGVGNNDVVVLEDS